MRAVIDDLFAAFAVLTRLPLPKQPAGKEMASLSRSVRAYPLVGGVIGGIGALVLLALTWLGLKRIACRGHRRGGADLVYRRAS